MVCAAVLCAVPAAALAQGPEPTAAEVAVARKLFTDAAELERAEKWSEAEAKLREAVAIKETPGVRYHLGYCLEQQGQLVAALVEYDRAQELLARGVKAPDVTKLVGPAAARVRGRAAQLTLQLSQAPADAKIEIDGVPVKPTLFGKAMPANPGKHVITATAPGRQSFRREITLGDAQAAEVTIDLPAIARGGSTLPAAAATKPAQRGSERKPSAPDGGSERRSSTGSTRTWVLIGEAVVTASALGVGIYYLIDKGNAQDEVDAADKFLAEPGHTPEELADGRAQRADLVDQRDRAGTLSTIGFVAAGVGATATVATFFLWKPASKKQSGVWIVPHAGGISAGARF